MELWKVHIRLRDKEDELVCAYNKIGGQYYANLGYLTTNEREIREPCWWWRKLWKVVFPPKSIVSLLLLMNMIVLTWDIMRRGNNHGLSMCILSRIMRKQITIYSSLALILTRFGWKLSSKFR